MEESTSTAFDPVDVVTGKAIVEMAAWTPSQWAKYVFESLDVVKRQLRFLPDFAGLPAILTREELKKESMNAWLPNMARLRYRIIDAGLDKEFGLTNRVVVIRHFEALGEGRDIQVFLTQKGGLRIVATAQDQRMHASLHRPPFPDIQVWSIRTVEDLAKFLIQIEDQHRVIHVRLYTIGHDRHFGNMAFWMADGIFELIKKHERLLQERLDPFTESRSTLGSWRADAAKIHSIRTPS